MADLHEEWRAALEAMVAAGCAPADPSVIVFDSRLHRYDVEGDRKGRRNGWFVFHATEFAHGSFGSWKIGQSHTWTAHRREDLTPEQRRRQARQIAEAQEQRREAQRALHAQARARAAALWARALPSVDPRHPYLVKKRVPALGLRQLRDLLVGPFRDTEGLLHSLQFINPEGQKVFLKNGAVDGYHHRLGEPRAGRALLLCEGYATGASLHQASGLPVAVCFNRVNLFPTAKALRRRFPDVPMVLAADDDRYTDDNPGRRDAEEAAHWVDGAVILPDFTGLDRSGQPTDFNDVHVLGGLEHLKRQITAQLAAVLPAEAIRGEPLIHSVELGQRGERQDRRITETPRRAAGADHRESAEYLAMTVPTQRNKRSKRDGKPEGGTVRGGTPSARDNGRPDLYQEVTDKIVAALEAGTAPWRRSWTCAGRRYAGAPAGPFNAATGRPYRGVNFLLLGNDPRAAVDPRWCGFQQAKAKGWAVKANAHGTVVYFYKWFGEAGPEETEDDDPATPRRRFAYLRRHTVFHASQIVGMPSMEEMYGPAEADELPWEIDGRLQALLDGTGARIEHCAADPGYAPKSDVVRVPPRAWYANPEGYYKSVFHELAHWTGHPSRLNRPLTLDRTSAGYAREELRAELASAFLGAVLNIPHDLQDHANYLKHYLDMLRGDNREIFRAARDAHAIADLLLNRHPDLELKDGVCVPRAESATDGAPREPAGDRSESDIPEAIGREFDDLLEPARRAAENLARWRTMGASLGIGCRLSAHSWSDIRPEIARMYTRIAERLAAIPDAPKREVARCYFSARLPDFALTHDEQTFFRDGSSAALPAPDWLHPTPGDGRTVGAERLLAPEAYGAAAPPGSATIQPSPAPPAGKPQAPVERALAAPYRWTIAALADPASATEGAPFDWVDRAFDVASLPRTPAARPSGPTDASPVP